MKRIGFLAASIHSGSALSLWTSLAREARGSNCAFIIFPGGRLDHKKDQEFLRNGVYRLANLENLDALICWGSSLGGSVTPEELNRFHESLNPLPYVTIAHKMDGHPCVRFDAYSGMKELVRHFVREHGNRRIAFIRGPETHASSNDRYRGYLDALREEGCPVPEDSPLITDCYSWGEGEAAAVQLYEERKLVPGQDFEVLIGSSDMMVFAAVRYFEGHGFRVPSDYAVGGFNNSPESRILSSSFTTVHMPYSDLGKESFKLVFRLLEGDSTASDIMLDADVLVRESCGCSKETRRPRDSCTGPLALIRELGDLFSLEGSATEALIAPVTHALLNGDEALFFSLFEKALIRFFESDRETRLVYDAMDVVRKSACVEDGILARFEDRMHHTILRAQGRVFALEKYETGRRNAVLNSLKCELLCARDKASLIAILARNLPLIGMREAAIVLYESETLSRCVGWFFAGDPCLDDTVFPARHLLPEAISSRIGANVYMVEPLFMENQPLGHFLHSVPFDDGALYEELRSAVSSALKGIFLFEEAAQARKIAELAERAKTEFFANVGTDLADPLSDLLERLDRLERAFSEDIHLAPESRDRLGKELSLVKAAIGTQLDTTRSLIDLTLSQVDSLILERKLVYIEDILKEAVLVPPVQGDAARLGKAFEVFRALIGSRVFVQAGERGLRIRFAGEGTVEQKTWDKKELLFSEKIIQLHYGECEKGSSWIDLFLPWPSLSGVPPAKNVEGVEYLDFPAAEDTLSRCGDNATLRWNASGAVLEDWLKVYSLRHHPRLFRAPFMLYGTRIEGESLLAAIEERLREESRGPILLIGTAFTRFGDWITEDNAYHIDSLSELPAALENILPSLIVFDRLRFSEVSEVRLDSRSVLVPILIISDTFRDESEIQEVCALPRVIVCNSGVADSPEFTARIRSIIAGGELLPPHTGALVKKAILYMNLHASSQIARWKLADSVNVSEDYLTRIFHREVGLSLWEYLNRYRIFLATELLLHTNESIYEIALKTGFQDQAYFCRVFKRLHGVPPGKMRNKKSE